MSTSLFIIVLFLDLNVCYDDFLMKTLQTELIVKRIRTKSSTYQALLSFRIIDVILFCVRQLSVVFEHLICFSAYSFSFWSKF